MKRIIAALLAFLMLLALSACGSKTPAESPTFDEPTPTVELERTPDPTPVPEAVVDPEEIEWGYQAPASRTPNTGMWMEIKAQQASCSLRTGV